jgi:hypothetical protein
MAPGPRAALLARVLHGAFPRLKDNVPVGCTGIRRESRSASLVRSQSRPPFPCLRSSNLADMSPRAEGRARLVALRSCSVQGTDVRARRETSGAPRLGSSHDRRGRKLRAFLLGLSAKLSRLRVFLPPWSLTAFTALLMVRSRLLRPDASGTRSLLTVAGCFA